MNDLLDKFNEYKSIVNYRLFYILDDDKQLEFKLKQTDFPHLIGLHKLIDIPIIRQFNDSANKTVSAKYLISKIKRETFITETDAIVDFDASLIGSSLSSNYILFEKKDAGYNYLCLAVGGDGKRYIESFFHNPKDLYIQGQHVVKIKKVEIYDSDNKLFLEDTLI